MDWISLAIAIALLVVAVYSGISYFREKKAISRVFRSRR
ncbi:TPA: small membrane protein [Klebsiella pneumoniae]|nr:MULTISPECIES: small membrane protein [Enterobacteriaceae]MBK3099680.1 small membrane protein [Klebsiella pneumoniae]MCU8622746.1 small membrane protein [Klebsiella pneumoniae]MDU0887589.1 small membrane protein [Klebsiella pneumoniae]MEB5772384.1 small membrane protein [Klebsiella pneumoniae]HBR5493615.1 small membrane protein [Klebsiella pneumoniae]